MGVLGAPYKDYRRDIWPSNGIEPFDSEMRTGVLWACKELNARRERENDPAHMWHMPKNWKKCYF